MTTQHQLNTAPQRAASTHVEISPVVAGNPFTVGHGFHASAFRQADFANLMDPLIMVDHYTMTKSTFGAHPHAGLSAVSLLLEDSVGEFNNRDSLGNDFDLHAGDLYWLKAGSGAIHDEAPKAGASIHGLQVFVNIPANEKQTPPASLHVKAKDMPILVDVGYRVKLALGELNGIKGATSPSVPLTIADGVLFANGTYDIVIPAGHNLWLTNLSGNAALFTQGETLNLASGQAVTISNRSHTSIDLQLHNLLAKETQFALFMGKPLNEDFVQKGPLVASSIAQMEKVEANLAAGLFGQISPAKTVLA